MEIVIKSAEIKSSMFLKYSFEQTTDTSKNSGSLTSDQPIHDDLRNAFRSLIPHFAFICEEVTDEKLVKKAIDNPEDYLEDIENAKDPSFFKYRVYGVTIKGKEEAEQLIINGSKKLNNGKSFGFSTPEFFVISSDYKFNDELQDVFEILKREIIAYIDGKQAPKVQMAMFNDELGFEEEEE